jgi:DNA polymerase-3 subunit gamma/tau
LAEVLGIAPLKLEVEAGAVTDSPAKREAAERDRRQREAEDLIRNDPLVQEMLAQFPSARIVPGSIKPH